MLAGQDADYDIPPHLKQLQSNERCQLITLTDSRRWAMLAGQMLIMASLRTSNSYRCQLSPGQLHCRPEVLRQVGDAHRMLIMASLCTPTLTKR